MRISLAIPIMLIMVCCISFGQGIAYPPTPKVDQVDTYFGTPVADPYRWLENDTAQNVAAWVEAENKLTFGYLEKIPYRQQIKSRLEKIFNYPKYSAPTKKENYYFFFKNDGLQNQSVLYIQQGVESTPEVLIDPNKLSADGTTRLVVTKASKDAKYFAYGLSKSGSDWEEYYVIDLATRHAMTDHLSWIKASDLAWQGNGFYYSRYDAPKDTGKAYSGKNEFHKIYYHLLGTEQDRDELIYEDKQHPQRFHFASTTNDERFLILSISDRGNGKDGNALYVRDLQAGEKSFHPLIEAFEDNFDVIDDVGGKLLVNTDKDAPNGKVVLIDPSRPEEKYWKVVLPEKTEVLLSVQSVGGKLVATYMKDVSHRVYVYNTDGVLQNEVRLPALGTTAGFSGEKKDSVLFYSFTSFTYPATIFKYNINTNTSTLFRSSDVDFKPEEYETKQVFYSSKDGTKIPMFIVYRKGTELTGNNAALLFGYGGFNISLTPGFNPLLIPLLEQGVVYALANLRGGGEYGEKWHQAGTKLNKQNVFDDFIAAGEWLVAQKYTTPEKLAIQGGSNGGLLVGAVMTQRPTLCKVALPAVGVMDMLRYQKFTIGWNWAPDYGSSDDSVGFNNLYKYSPLHNIKEGVHYPATFVTTADHDDRVVPAHSFKFMATLQERNKGKNPVLIRIETKSGHGASSTSKRLEMTADMYSFMFYNLGITPKY